MSHSNVGPLIFGYMWIRYKCSEPKICFRIPFWAQKLLEIQAMEVSEIQEIHVIPISDSSFQVKMNRFRPANDKTDREMIRDRTDRAKTIRDIEEPMRGMLPLILKNHSIWLFKKKGKVTLLKS